MKREKSDLFDLDKLHDTQSIQSDLLMSSLYLAAFELIKISIVDGVKDYFLGEFGLSDEKLIIVKRNSLEIILQAHKDEIISIPEAISAIKEKIRDYEKQVMFQLDDYDAKKLIPSAEWLVRMGVLEHNDIEIIQGIRSHRNKMAHEIPYILTNRELDLNYDRFANIRYILHKVETFWFQCDGLAIQEISIFQDITNLNDIEAFSTKEAILEIIANAVREHILKQIKVVDLKKQKEIGNI